MKEIFYNEYNVRQTEIKVLLTDKEFTQAVDLWEKGKGYWCEREEIYCMPNPIISRTPRDEFGRGEILIDPFEQFYTRYIKRNDKVYEICDIKSENTSDLVEVPMSPKRISRLVNQEEYFDNREKYRKLVQEEFKKQLESPHDEQPAK